MIEVNKELAEKVKELVQQGKEGKAIILIRTIIRCTIEEATEYIRAVVTEL